MRRDRSAIDVHEAELLLANACRQLWIKYWYITGKRQADFRIVKAIGIQLKFMMHIVVVFRTYDCVPFTRLYQTVQSILCNG